MEEGPVRGMRRNWILVALMLTMMLAAMDNTIVATAIPQIVGDLGGFSLFSWLFSIYLLIQTITIPVYGKLADIFGRKPILITGVTIFLVGSAACASAWDMHALIFFRGLQAVGAGSIMATVNTIAGDRFYPSWSLTDCGDGNFISTAYGLQPGTYYGLISGGPVDTYSAQVSAAMCIPPPANDHCADVVPQALAIGDSLTFTGHVSSATSDGDFGPDFPGGQTVRTVWHAFTTTECAKVTVAFCGMNDPYWSYFNFLSTTCPVDSVFISGSGDWEQCVNGTFTFTYWDLPAGTYYLPIGDIDGYDWPCTVDVHATACGPYCAAWALSTTPCYEKISQVTFAGIDRSSTSGLGYEYFLLDTAFVERGSSFPITVALSNGYPGDQVLAWIDFDGDEVFQENELVFSSEVSAGPFSGTDIIPVDAATGNTRMRLRMHDAGHPDWANDAPCGMADYGQVEDYTVLVDAGSGIREAVQGRFAVMPNPAADQLTITFASTARPLQLLLFDATGRVVLEQAVAGTSGPLVLDMGTKERGVYMVQVRFADGTQALERVVKE